MSGAGEGVALQERIDTLEAALVTVRVNLMRDPTKTEAVCEFARSVLRGDTLLEAVVAAEAVTTPPAGSYADEDVETQWEVWEDDLMVASSTDEAEARHYLAVYPQDGPVRLLKSVTVRTPVA